MRELSADSERWWALQLARGGVEREGVTYFGRGAVTAWAVCRSVRGTTRQLDVIANGELVTTAGKRRVDQLLKRKS